MIDLLLCRFTVEYKGVERTVVEWEHVPGPPILSISGEPAK